MALREDILALADEYGRKRRPDIDPETDIFRAYRIDGDGIHESLDGFAERFETDLGGLLWYFHYNANEPPSIPQSVFPVGPDGNRLPPSPITLTDHFAAAEAGRWTVAHPPHEAREVLWSKLNRWLVIGFLIAAVLLWTWSRVMP